MCILLHCFILFCRFHYELLIASGTVLNETTIAFKRLTNRPPIFLRSPELSHLISTPTNFSIGIRIRTALGYTSPIGKVERIEIHPPAISAHFDMRTNATCSCSSTSKWAIAAIVLLVMLISVVFVAKFYRFKTNAPRNYAVDTILMTSQVSASDDDQ